MRYTNSFERSLVWKKIYTTVICTAVFFIFAPYVVSAATLSFSPSSGSYTVGSPLSVGVFIQSPNDAVNAVSGTFSFNKDILEVTSISKNQSIIALWVQEPSFSNTLGTVSFEGIALNPGFKGANGKIITVTFRIKNPGEATLLYSTGSILANDGNGTNVLTGMGTAKFIIEQVQAVTPASVVSEPAVNTETQTQSTLQTEKPSLPVLTSTEFETADTWSATTTGTFTFTVPKGVIAMRLLVDAKPDSIPTITYEPPIATREITELADGVSYLHVQYKNAQGWGEVLHRKLSIDTHAPESVVVTQVIPGVFSLAATDALSGIAYYEIQIDSGAFVRFVDGGNHLYTVPQLEAGEHTITAKVHDAAGNVTQAQQLFSVAANTGVAQTQQQSPAVPPTFTQEFLQRGGVVVIVLSAIVPSVALVVILCGLLYMVWRSLGGLRKHVDKEVLEAKMTVYKAFSSLRTDLEEDIATLQKASVKRKLTKEETRIIKRLQINIHEAEKVIIDEISDIEKPSQ